MPTTLGLDERFVVRLWDRRAIPRQLLLAMNLDVIYPGNPSDAGGPDYQDAILSWGERFLITGDVEFHVRSSDWLRHGHHRNRAYNNVILHVVWDNDTGDTVREDGRRVPILELSTAVSAQDAHRSTRSSLPLVTAPCVQPLRALSTDAVLERIDEAAARRMRQREEHFVSQLRENDADQVIYAGVLEAMGYASNRDAFRELADAAPYSWLRSISPAAWEQALLTAAGLRDAGPPTPGRLRPERWRLARLRPGNHPATRLAGAAQLLARFAPRLSESVASTVLAAPHRGRIRALFVCGAGQSTLIGAGRADELVASAILPFVGLLGRDRARAWNLMSTYYSPPSTRWTRAMQSVLMDAGHSIRPRSAAQHQGMHFVYTRHCRYDTVSGCPLCGDLQK